MNIRNFRLNILLRILLTLTLGYLAYFFVAKTPFWLMSFWMGLFAFLTLANLIYYIEKSYRELTNFLLAIKQNDFTSVYPEKSSNTRSLNQVFNVITREFQKIKNEKESNFLFFKTVVEHSGVPLLAYSKSNQNVWLTNLAFQDLLAIHSISKMSSLKNKFPDLFEVLVGLNNNEKILYKMEINGELLQLSIAAREIHLNHEPIFVVSFNNINSELDQKEIESWQRLIRVLTHEIKNSAIPISTLTEVIQQMIENLDGTDKKLAELDEEDEEDLRVSIKTIGKRSKGLVKFVEAYGDLARVPKPQVEEVELIELVRDIVNLQKRSGDNKTVELLFTSNVDHKLLQIDPSMLEQVLINLIKNGLEAIENASGKVEVQLESQQDRVLIVVEDNGPGMDKETLDNIFVPFFTTKEKGSGIGLSLSRQIIKAHKGNMKANSEPGEGTRFEISLPC